MADHNEVMLLSCDWGIDPSPHLTQVEDFGIMQNEKIIFGFSCSKCGSKFRSDFGNDLQFSEAVLGLIPWAQAHQHRDEDLDHGYKRVSDSYYPARKVQN